MSGQVAVVTGASRGIGRGIAIGLGEAGATVVVTGRSAEALVATAELVMRAGGHGVALACDHRRDEEVAAVFEAIARELGEVDVLVNNATAVPDLRVLFAETPFWEVTTSLWDDLYAVGLRSHFVASKIVAPAMVARRSGLIVNISSVGAVARIGGVLPYGVFKAALHRMTEDIAEDLRPHHVTALSLWPPPTSTPGMLAATGPDDDPSSWSRPEFTGRVVAALAASDHFLRTGEALRVRELGGELGVDDVRYQETAAD